jgi:hypothetical protein
MTALLYILLAIVAAAAAVLSFDAMRGLALLTGFTPGLAWLLPVVVDAGAAAGTLVWLLRDARRPHLFGRSLALVLLTSSVAGNAVSHGLAEYNVRPPWWLVVIVSGVAPAVLGAVVHLAVLVGHAQLDPASPAVARSDQKTGASVGEEREETGDETPDRATQLIAAGAGRRRIARELAITEYEARLLLENARNGHALTATNGDQP